MFSYIRYLPPGQYSGHVSLSHTLLTLGRLMSRMKDCYGSGHEAHWQMDVSQASAIKSRVYEDSNHEEWCLDAGMDDENTNGQPVVINKVRLLSRFA